MNKTRLYGREVITQNDPTMMNVYRRLHHLATHIIDQSLVAIFAIRIHSINPKGIWNEINKLTENDNLIIFEKDPIKLKKPESIYIFCIKIHIRKKYLKTFDV